MIKKFLKNQEFLMDVFETMRDGLMVVDKEGRILFFNRAAEEITGYRKEEVIGGPCMVLDTDTCMFSTDSGRQKRCDLFKDGIVRDKQCRIRRNDGRAVYLMKNAVVLKDDKGKIIGAVESMTDVTSFHMKEMELEELKQDLKEEYSFHGLLGKSASMLSLYEQVKNAARSEAPVLIYGETGTGKNLVANAIHALSRRKNGPFIQMNCASLNESLCESELFGHRRGSFTGAINDRMGRFEAAHNGTFFLDEIGDMPLSMQVKVLRALEEKVVERVGDNISFPVNIRLISATNKDLHAQIAGSRFREDLFYRINSIFIQVPPLRERTEDIPHILNHYLKKISCANSKDIRRVSSPAMELIDNYQWPGNVRQLINALEHSSVTAEGDTIEVSDLPKYLINEEKVKVDKNAPEHSSVNDKGDTMDVSDLQNYLFHEEKAKVYKNALEREKIQSALSLYKGNKTLTAKHLGMSRVTLWKKLEELGLD
jgi:PAS domain S-box-containing protein